VDAKDPYTRGHSERVLTSEQLARAMICRAGRGERQDGRRAARYREDRDPGQDPAKAGRLTTEEFDVMRGTRRARAIVRRSRTAAAPPGIRSITNGSMAGLPDLSPARTSAARAHHCIADSFDAMTRNATTTQDSGEGWRRRACSGASSIRTGGTVHPALQDPAVRPSRRPCPGADRSAR